MDTRYLTRTVEPGTCRWDKFESACPNPATKEAYNGELKFRFCDDHIIEALYKLVLEEITERVLRGETVWLTPQE